MLILPDPVEEPEAAESVDEAVLEPVGEEEAVSLPLIIEEEAEAEALSLPLGAVEEAYGVEALVDGLSPDLLFSSGS